MITGRKIYVDTIMAKPDESLTTPKTFMGTALSYNPIITFLYFHAAKNDSIQLNTRHSLNLS